MKLRLFHIIPALAAVLLAACISEMDTPAALQQGTFSIELAADSLTVEVETRAPRELTDAEAAGYLVTLQQNGTAIWERKAFNTITQADRTQASGDGYVVTAEDITADEAEADNGGWGTKRNAGSSEVFSITPNHTAHITVPCAMANAGLCVSFDESFTNYFSEYAVTTDDLRSLKFNATNAAQFDTNNHLTSGSIAYYNTDANRQHNVDILITAAAGWDGTLRLIRTVTLHTGKITRLLVKLNSGEPTEGNISILLITYDDFEETAGEEIILE